MKAIVDSEKCIGCGLCAQVAPEVYRMEGDIALAIEEDVSLDQMDEAKTAMQQCPVDAIQIK